MSDREQQTALRRGLEGSVEDQARWLAGMVRAGNIQMECVWIACVIGDPAARLYANWGSRTVNDYGTVQYSIPMELSHYFGANNAWEADHNIESLIGLLRVAGNMWVLERLPCLRCRNQGATTPELCFCTTEDGLLAQRTVRAGLEAAIRAGLTVANLMIPGWERAWRRACNGGNGICSPPSDHCPDECHILQRSVRGMKTWLRTKNDADFTLLESELNILNTITDVDPLFRDIAEIADDLQALERFRRGHLLPVRTGTQTSVGRMLKRSAEAFMFKRTEEDFREAIRRELIPWLFTLRSP